MNSSRMRQMGESMGLAAIVATYIFVLVPFTIYIGNINEITVPYFTIIKTYLPAVVFFIATFGLLGMLMPAHLYRGYTALLACLGILIWVQGNLLVWDYGLLDGRAINWSEDVWRGWLEIAIWGAGILFVIFFWRSIGQRVISAAVILFLLQLCIFGYNWVSNSSELANKNGFASANQSPDELSQFSSQKNVIHILADGFQSDIFEDIIADEKRGKDISARLQGFTFYRDHLGVFPYTHMSIPAILSSKIYRNDIPIKKFINSAFAEKSILNTVHDAGYDIDMVVPGSLLYMYKQGRYTNLSTVPGQLHVSDSEFATRAAAKLIDLGLFRVSPHFLKQKIYNDQLWFMQSLLADKKYMSIKYFADRAFLSRLSEDISITRKKPVYKYFHLMLSHNPMVTNQQCAYAGRVLPTVRQNVKAQASCALDEILKLFDELKKQGVYNESLIILMADHGAWVPPRQLTGRLLDDGKTAEVINPKIMALSQPLLAIKRPGETGVLKISDVPSSIIDTAATVADVLQLDADYDGRSVFNLQKDEKRVRSHLVYEYRRSEWTDDYLSPIQEFSIHGKGVDSSSWRDEVIHLPAGKVFKATGKSSLWQTLEVVK